MLSVPIEPADGAVGKCGIKIWLILLFNAASAAASKENDDGLGYEFGLPLIVGLAGE